MNILEALPREFAPMLTPPDARSLKRVVCVQPHPDDVEIGMGGIVAALANNGCHIAYITVTNGDKGNLDRAASPEETAAIRRAEAQAAGKHLGASVFYFLDHGDGALDDTPALAREVAEILRVENPDAVFCPDPWLPYEGHWDHIVTGRAVSYAFQMARGVSAIGYYFTAKPNAVMDITHAFERKMEAVALHKSQIDPPTYAMYRAYFEAKGRALGERLGYGISEGVKLLGRVHTHCFAEASDI
ncbi:MAG: PIG-L family deacetylase [Oscillospiraceae bacterium]|jgi:LmbE family N-acetylglucosaminyl deacetylase|nr:PIG-L family deacetylase [Oscillospiraceae bacterium]